MITEGMFTSKSEMWETPQMFFNELNKKYHFTTDVCAIAENAKCKHFYSPEDNGLIQEWSGTCYMNPPYGKQIKHWVRKAYEEAILNKRCIVVALLPARTDTQWFHAHIYQKSGVSVSFLKGRLKFSGSKNSAPFPSMVVVFNHNFTPW